jgi:hypothetical protein
MRSFRRGDLAECRSEARRRGHVGEGEADLPEELPEEGVDLSAKAFVRVAMHRCGPGRATWVCPHQGREADLFPSRPRADACGSLSAIRVVERKSVGIADEWH